MDQAAADLDLLFGLIALERGVDVDVLGAALDVGASGGGVSLGHALRQRGELGDRELSELERGVRDQVQAHGGDVSAALAAKVGSFAPGKLPSPLTLATFRRALDRFRVDLDSTQAVEMTQAATMALPSGDGASASAADLESTIAASLAPSPLPVAQTLVAPASVGEQTQTVENLDDASEATVGAQPSTLDADRTITADAHGDDGMDATQAMTASEPGRSFVAESAVAPAGSRLRYRIVREHAKGGLGEVFVAYDEELNREVALKEIQGRHADNSESRARFMIEAEVTGGLEHPGIVPVYGLGQYPDGRPYYAMRFIRGQSLKEAIARFHKADVPGRDPGERELGLRQLLAHFLSVCNAMAYAHARGVIHRDIKPANVMLGGFGETLVVDWGLAKALGQPSSEATETVPALRPLSGSAGSGTLYGSSVGTPQYMSPEQAGGLLDEMGPPSDIYSLGATLYCLLTGEPPFRERNLLALLDQVKKGAFPPPRQVKPVVPRALEAVCLKAMALKPADRYGTVLELAADIERWLGDEPVSVYREPWQERAVRWAKRHKTAVATAAGLIIASTMALLIGTIVVQRERARTEANFRLATNAVDDLLTEVGEVELAEVPQMELVRRQLLERALKYYGKFLEEKRYDPTTRFETSRAQIRLGDIDELLSNYTQAEDKYHEATKILRSLVGEPPVKAAGFSLGGDDSSQFDYRRDLARARHGLGVLLTKSNRFREAEVAFREALAIRKELAATSESERAAYDDSLYRLGALLAKLSKREPEVTEAYEAAERDMKALVAKDPANPEYRRRRARYLNNIGILLRYLQPAKARAMFREALDIQTALSDSSPGTAGYRWAMARTSNNLGGSFQEAEPPDLAQSEPLYRSALENFTKLASDFPDVPDYRSEQAMALTNLAVLAARTRGPKQVVPKTALDDLDRAVTLLDYLTAEYPDRPDYRHKLAQVRTRRGIVGSLAGDLTGAREALKEAIEGLRLLIKQYPEVPEYQSDLGLALRNVANIYEKEKTLADHEDVLLEAIDHQRTAVAATTRNDGYRQFLAGDLYFLGSHRLTMNRFTDSAKAAAQIPDLVPDNTKLKLRAAQILARCLGSFDSEGTRSKDDPLRKSYREQVFKILSEAVEKREMRVEELDHEDFRPLQELKEFQDLRKVLRKKMIPPAPPAVG